LAKENKFEKQILGWGGGVDVNGPVDTFNWSDIPQNCPHITYCSAVAKRYQIIFIALATLHY